jgi:hypothetical protein
MAWSSFWTAIWSGPQTSGSYGQDVGGVLKGMFVNPAVGAATGLYNLGYAALTDPVGLGKGVVNGVAQAIADPAGAFLGALTAVGDGFKTMEGVGSAYAGAAVSALGFAGLAKWLGFGKKAATRADVAPRSGKVWQDFLPEAEARLAAAKAKYGDGAVMMALSRKQALSRLEGLERQVLRHIDEHIPETIGKAPTAVSHWRKEVGGYLDEMERMTPHIGKKSAADWQARIDSMRQRLINLLGEE